MTVRCTDSEGDRVGVAEAFLLVLLWKQPNRFWLEVVGCISVIIFLHGVTFLQIQVPALFGFFS